MTQKMIDQTRVIPARRLCMAVAVVALGLLVSACETNQMLDVSGLWPADDKKVAEAESGPVGEKKVASAEGATNSLDEEDVVLQGPGNTPASGAAKNSDYPDLENQPKQPTNLLKRDEADIEIEKMKTAGETHVSDRESGLNVAAFNAEDVRNKKAAAKKESGGIFDLDWLKSESPKAPTDNLSPPEKLRLARAQAITPDLTGENDTVSTGTGEETVSTLDLAPVREVAPAPVQKTQELKSASAGKSDSAAASVDLPTSSQPKRIFFSSGAKELSAGQQKPLDELAGLRGKTNAIIYVLGFAGVDPDASAEQNIESQDLAIARANYVAVGLRKRGFSGDRVVVQVVDETVEARTRTGAARRRVEVYFGGRTALRQSVVPNGG